MHACIYVCMYACIGKPDPSCLCPCYAYGHVYIFVRVFVCVFLVLCLKFVIRSFSVVRYPLRIRCRSLIGRFRSRKYVQVHMTKTG